MADKLIGGLFARARNTTRRRYAASAGDVGRLMRMFHGTIEALAVAQANERDAFGNHYAGQARATVERGTSDDGDTGGNRRAGQAGATLER